jgi:hypothetical protein
VSDGGFVGETFDVGFGIADFGGPLPTSDIINPKNTEGVSDVGFGIESRQNPKSQIRHRNTEGVLF